MRQRLRELKRSPEDLAEAVEVPPEYILALMSGARRAPLPERTDVYERMTTFLRLGRNDLVTRARAERAAGAPVSSAPADVRRMLLALCEPATARQLERRTARRANAELAQFFERVIAVAQGAVRRVLDDPIGLRRVASQRGATYAATRLQVLEFLDVTPATVTVEQLAEFVQPRIARWDVDLPSGVLRVVLRGQEVSDRPRRAAGARPGAPPAMGED
jgi:hypothetical protein